jgi:hypothetical protein
LVRSKGAEAATRRRFADDERIELVKHDFTKPLLA